MMIMMMPMIIVIIIIVIIHCSHLHFDQQVLSQQSITSCLLESLQQISFLLSDLQICTAYNILHMFSEYVHTAHNILHMYTILMLKPRSPYNKILYGDEGKSLKKQFCLVKSQFPMSYRNKSTCFSSKHVAAK